MKTYNNLEVVGNNNSDLLKGEKEMNNSKSNNNGSPLNNKKVGRNEMKMNSEKDYSSYSGDELYEIGHAILYGKNGYSENFDEACRLLIMSASRGNLSAMAEEAWLMLTLATNDKDKNCAFHIIKELAEENNPRAMFLLSGCYYEGKFVKEDMAKGIEYLKEASELGYPDASSRLSAMYFNGDGVECNIESAIHYCKTAAELDDPLSQFHLGVAYSQGLGIQQNHVEAIKWLRKASHNGVEESRTYLIQNYSTYHDEATNALYINC